AGLLLFFFQAEDGIRDFHVTGVQTCALPISATASRSSSRRRVASRGAAIRMCGTDWSSARSHMPWWLGPSGPVTPARSSTKVTPDRKSVVEGKSVGHGGRRIKTRRERAEQSE